MITQKRLQKIVAYFQDVCESQCNTRVSKWVILATYFKLIAESKGCEDTKTIMETKPREMMANEITEITQLDQQKYVEVLQEHLESWMDTDCENDSWAQRYTQLRESKQLAQKLQEAVHRYYAEHADFCYSDGFASQHEEAIFALVLDVPEPA